MAEGVTVITAGATVLLTHAVVVLTLPPGVVTWITVLAGAALGTVVVICVSESTWNVAAADPNATAVAPVK